jgi:hypothetical protein
LLTVGVFASTGYLKWLDTGIHFGSRIGAGVREGENNKKASAALKT